jgi:hypothetical protein
VIKTFTLCGLLAFAGLGNATPRLVMGIPNSQSTTLTPSFGTLINFDDLAPLVAGTSTGFYPLPPGQYATEGVSSISNSPTSNPLFAAFFSQQSQPVYLTTGPNANFAGNITITLSKPASRIGIGVLSDNTTPVTLNALAANGTVLNSFTVATSASGPTPSNGYWIVQDSALDIQSLQIISATNLGIDDLQFLSTPEPKSLSLLAFGAVLLIFGMLRKERTRR